MVIPSVVLLANREDLMQCWGCDCRTHRACLSAEKVEPWNCDRYIDSLAKKRDLTLDKEVLRCLVAVSLPDDPKEA